MIRIKQLDHLALTASNIELTVNFYTTILGMEKTVFEDGRVALNFGQQKINLHQLGNELEPKASNANAGTVDLCLITEQPITWIVDFLKSNDIEIIDGPAVRTGARSKLMSINFHDPDGNLIEVSNYITD